MVNSICYIFLIFGCEINFVCRK